jgi:hypothetical protein
MTAINALTVASIVGSILLFAWWGLDRLEVRRQRARLAEDVIARKRLGPVIGMTEWRRK